MTDLIRRADAIEAIRNMPVRDLGRASNMTLIGKGEAIVKLYTLPSAEAVQGEWIEVEVFPEVYDIEGVKTWGSEMQCDQCGFRHTAIEGHMAQYNFCPNCGAKMKGGAE